MSSDISRFLKFDPSTQKLTRVVQQEYSVDASQLVKNLESAKSLTLLPMLTKNAFITTGSDQLNLVYNITSLEFLNEFTATLHPEKDKDGKNTSSLVYVPHYIEKSTGIRHEAMQFFYTPQPGTFLFLVLNVSEARSYLVMIDQKTGGMYFPGLPNVYKDTKLCTGAASVPGSSVAWTRGLDAYMQLWLKAWMGSKFNDDLSDGVREGINAFCRFDLHGRSIPVEDWENYVSQVPKVPVDIMNSCKLVYTQLTKPKTRRRS